MTRDSLALTEQYIDEDFQEFISVEKMELMKLESQNVLVCLENQIHDGVRKDGENLFCAECGSGIKIIKRVL